ncbi:hypothetical protein KI387_010082 [Taxus chinensis]|uniref:DUF7751 domain-containing protein n=1 Tax=Taxus chinensis TaxID=29808 RepID=A0AA38FLB7_TAXCH|nr:hypothetical protein KI387_010082 [Taxus chinensis]
MSLLLPYNIDIKPPEDNAKLEDWKSKLEEDMKAIQFQDNRNHVSEVLAANDVECDDLGSICFGDAVLLSNYIEEIVVSAISHQLMNTEEPNYRGGRLIISSQSLAHGLSIFRAGELSSKDTLKMESNGEPPQDPTNGKAEAKMEPSTENKPKGEKSDAASKGDASKKDADKDMGTLLQLLQNQ